MMGVNMSRWEEGLPQRLHTMVKAGFCRRYIGDAFPKIFATSIWNHAEVVRTVCEGFFPATRRSEFSKFWLGEN